MKKLLMIPMLFMAGITSAQVNIDQLLEAGIGNAQRFSESYFAPVGEGVIDGISNGWYNSGKAKKLFRFEIGVIGNLSFVTDEEQSFELNINEYEDLSFRNGATSAMVATVFGENESDVTVVVNEGQLGEFEITLPDGIGDTGINFIPTGFLQASMGLPKGFEVKARFLPKVKTDDTTFELYGVGVQHELTNWIPGWDVLPIRISGVIGYTNLKGSYDFSEDSVISGSGQEIEFDANSWLFSAVISTKLPIINFYGGIGFVTGESTTDLKGTYEIQRGSLANQTLVDPISVSHNNSGVKATVGTKLKLGFFGINADYSFQKYNNLVIGLNFGF